VILIVDASVALKWFVPEDLSEAADRLLVGEDDLASPDFLLLETANALWKKRRLGELSEAEAEAALTDLASGTLALRPSAPLVPRALAMAHELDHPVYDCLYLALAETEDGTVVTADRSFLKRVAGSRWRDRITWVERTP
jgi:predicted nucleic acid-binding protein